MNELRVEMAGVCASVQDLGRWLYQRFGVAVGGAMDQDSHRLANILVGNSSDAATIEIAWHGSAFSFAQPALIAITGADLQPTISGERFPIQRPVWIPKNRILQFHHPKDGCYSYLAVAGGFEIPQSLNSRSTHLRSAIGGLNGRPLQKNDVLPIGIPSSMSQAIRGLISIRTSSGSKESEKPSSSMNLSQCWESTTWFVDSSWLAEINRKNEIQVVRGRHFEWLDEASQRRFWNGEFTISHESDRMGFRLNGPELQFNVNRDLLSGGVARGTIQLPAGGNPIVLMADAAPTGGYPCIAHVISADFSRMAQMQPGQSVRFVEVDLAHAHRRLLARDRSIHKLIRAIERRANHS